MDEEAAVDGRFRRRLVLLPSFISFSTVKVENSLLRRVPADAVFGLPSILQGRLRGPRANRATEVRAGNHRSPRVVAQTNANIIGLLTV